MEIPRKKTLFIFIPLLPEKLTLDPLSKFLYIPNRRVRQEVVLIAGIFYPPAQKTTGSARGAPSEEKIEI